jgi:hypothetical protein
MSSLAVRRAVERHAMAQALVYYRRRGFKVLNVSRTQPFDVLAVKDHQELMIEVKGTASPGDAVFLTRNEVRHAREHAASTALFIVHSVDVRQSETRTSATGGRVRVHFPWVIDESALEALQYRYMVPPVE